MKLKYKPQAVKQLGRLPRKEKRKAVRKLEMLSKDPQTGKPLRGEFEGLRSLRAWPYRIIYEIQGDSVIIYSIAHRQSVYR